MSKPNFFIIGAPKCGTTSLANWLSDHPEIFLSDVKEPHFFSDDLNSNKNRNIESYLDLFKLSEKEHKVIGEASTHYLYSRRAVPNIINFIDKPKFVVMLRNPIEMAPSLHEQRVVNTDEHIKDFQEAWKIQGQRKNGEYVSKWCTDSELLQYGEICKLGEQLKRLYSLVPKDQVHVVLLEDIKENPKSEYEKILYFLNVKNDDRSNFKTFNSAKKNKFDFIRKLIKYISFLMNKLKIKPLRTGILTKLKLLNTKPIKRNEISDEMKIELQEYFYEDIKLLSSLLDRDLSHWINKP